MTFLDSRRSTLQRMAAGGAMCRPRRLDPGEITRFKVRFDIEGRYVWHCHILEYEDNETMRPIQVGRLPTGF